ncbi:hypothetical protein OG21DRAFT_1215967 [Imleria badia]|nr:hypothetical protein OG21DRAFT_1215967 [Imleria badia]
MSKCRTSQCTFVPRHWLLYGHGFASPRPGRVPSASVIGCDIRREFIDLGYTFYSDHDTFPAPFFVGDVFDIPLRLFPQAVNDKRTPLKDIRNLNYVYAGSLFHLFDEGTQEAIARRLATLLDVSKGNGPAVLFGRHVASAQKEEGVIDDAMGQYIKQRVSGVLFTTHEWVMSARTRYAHSPASWGSGRWVEISACAWMRDSRVSSRRGSRSGVCEIRDGVRR